MSSLTVNTNLSALSAYNSLNATDAQETKAIGELSSGLSIQTAADGPAAYVTSQSLTAQSNGYQTAMANAQNGVSLIQTASGALNQISSVLQTMNELAISSANGATNDSTSLAANQQEFAALQNEINQIAGTTRYGTTNLLDGSFTNQSLQVGAFDNPNQQISLSISAVDATSLGVSSSGTGTAGTAGYVTGNSAIATTSTVDVYNFGIIVDGGSEQSIEYTESAGKSAAQQVSDLQAQLNSDYGNGVVVASINGSGDLQITSGTTGANSSVTIPDMADIGNDLGIGGGVTPDTTSTQGSPGTGSPGISVDTPARAASAITAIQDAISKVDSIEAQVGAVQNELQAIGANLTVGQQNLSAAASQLTDVNMAQEMTVFSTDQILMQTGTAMLSQAQQAPNLVLKLI